MRNSFKRIITVVAAFAIAFTSLPVMGSGLDVHAAAVKAPAQVKNLKVKSVTQTSVKITWSKIAKNKNTKGYAIYRNGKLIKRVSYKTNTFTNKKLKAGTKYKFAVRAYNKYKQKQYYNSKTKKWQAKKPATKYWKKVRTVTRYKYGKLSATKQVTMKKPAKKNATKTATSTSSSKTPQITEIDTGFSGSTYETIKIVGNTPTVSVTYNPKGGDVTWKSYNTSVVKIKHVSNKGGVSTATLQGGTNYDDYASVKATYNKKVSNARYSGSNEFNFGVRNIETIACTETRIMNKYPIYDFSTPSFSGIPEESVRKVFRLWINNRNEGYVFLYAKFSGKLNNDKISFFNKTTGTEVRYVNPHDSFNDWYGRDLRKPGYTILSLADVNYKSVDTGELTRGGYLLVLELRENSVRQGNNTIEMRYSDIPIKTFTLNAKSRSAAYINYIKKAVSGSSPSNSYTYKNITKNQDLWKKLVGVEKYIDSTSSYPHCVYEQGNLRLESITYHGNKIIDNGMGGCEDSNAIMTLCAMYLGVDAECKYINNSSGYIHCICRIKDSERLFGIPDIQLDATPSNCDYYRMNQEDYRAYVNAFPKVL